MGLTRREVNPDIPAVSTIQTCRYETTPGNRCGDKADYTITFSVQILEKDVPVTLPVCQKHLEVIQGPIGPFSIGEKDE